MFVCAEGEQMEGCDNTALPNDESLPENVDSDVDQNYSLSVDSYADNSDSNSSTPHEVNICLLNFTQYV